MEWFVTGKTEIVELLLESEKDIAWCTFRGAPDSQTRCIYTNWQVKKQGLLMKKM